MGWFWIIGKVARDCTESDLRDAFGAYGELSRCTLKRGFAFVTFQQQEHADEALHALNGKDLLGSCLFIEPAKERKPGIYLTGPLPFPYLLMSIFLQ